MGKEVGDVKKNELAQPGEPRLGFEEPIDQKDLIIPIAKLFQGTPTEQEQYPNAKTGQIINSLTQEVLPATFVPVFKWTEVVKFNPRKESDPGYDTNFEPGALIWKCTSPDDPRWAESEWGENGEKPLADKTMCFLCYFTGVPMPVIIRFARTSYKAGKKLLSLAQFSGGNMFDRRYKLSSKKEGNQGNIYHILVVELSGMAEQDERAVAMQWYKDLSPKKETMQVHDPVHADFTE